jgi:N6-L-threonylcarbamoyladenine synthase
MYILAIETSCDETAVAILSADKSTQTFETIAHIVYSQISEHAPFDGVVPGLASRLHAKKLPSLIEEILDKVRTILPDFQHPDFVAVTYGPGLSPALHQGVNTAKMLSSAWQVPLIPINHLHGHLWSYLLDGNLSGKIYNSDDFPFLTLIVSGGHTILAEIKNFEQYHIIGQTLDDAAGEAFDKVAKMLGLGYPGGPIVSQLAQTHRVQHPTSELVFPRPMRNHSSFDFSFSGLKTAVLYHLHDITNSQESSFADIDQTIKEEICRAFEDAVVDILTHKTFELATQNQIRHTVLAGGVSANQTLQKTFQDKAEKLGIKIYIPDRQLHGDNAVMIGAVAILKIFNGQNNFPLPDVKPNLAL